MNKLDIDTESNDRVKLETPTPHLATLVVNDSEHDTAVAQLNASEAKAIRNWLTKFIEENEL